MFWASLLLALAPAPGQDEVAPLVAQLVELGDESQPADLERLAQFGTREAAEGLVTVFDELASVAMRRDAVRALATFDGVPGAEQLALSAIASCATGTDEPVLYGAAIDALAGCPSLGRHFLRQIADSPAKPAVRERALRRHIELAEEADLEWYAEVFEGPRDRKPYRGEEADAPGPPLMVLRELALSELAPSLKSGDLVKLAKEHRRSRNEPRLDGLRRLALAELARREHSQAFSLASKRLDDTSETPRNRVEAARLLFAMRGARMSSDFIKTGLGDASVVPMELRLVLAELVREMDSEKVEKKLLAQVRKAEGDDALFCLTALADSRSPKFHKQLLERLADPVSDLRSSAARILGEFGDPQAFGPLMELMERDADIAVVRACIVSLGQLSTSESQWRRQLKLLARDRRAQVRNAALEQLIELGGTGVEDLVEEAFGHGQWSTRLIALDYYEAERTREATGRIIGRMPDESGFMLGRFAEALWRLTGEPHRSDAKRWGRWWKDKGDEFEPLSAEDLALREAAEERRRLSQSTKAKTFFGVKLESRRMIFIIDISGSMDELLLPRRGEERGEPRMAVARRELASFLAGLDNGTLFNVIVFSSEAGLWRSAGAVSSNPETRGAAVDFVTSLRAFGGTNLYGALELAFEDTDIDTIVLLSDGEPSMGRETAPYMIRRRVSEWNANRGAVIHTIAVGSSLAVLEDLATDTGGTYVEFE